MRLACFDCGKSVSTEVGDETIVRAIVTCPECFERKTMESEAPAPEVPVEPQERMLKWFEFGHLPERLQAISKPFGILANEMCEVIMRGPERTVSLRKLLEAKDAAVRAALNPGC